MKDSLIAIFIYINLKKKKNDFLLFRIPGTMLSADVFTSFPGQMWEKVLSKVNKAVVFMDEPCAESLHWSGGAALLFEAGARNVKRFSSFEAGTDNEPKAVFVVSTLLKGRTADIIKDIISLSRFRYCVMWIREQG